MSGERLNLVAIGATGAGKSSFLNYLLGTSIFQTSLSVPSTGYGVFEREMDLRGFPIRLLDTWGLEEGKTEEWLKFLKGELERRENKKDIAECFHAVCYIIEATGNRVQEFDLRILSELVESGYSVVVVLSKAAKVSQAVLDAMHGEVAKKFGDGVPVVPVNSVRETLVGGQVVEVFGSHAFEQRVVLMFWETIRRRIPRIVEQKLVEFVDQVWIAREGAAIAARDRNDFLDSESVTAALHGEASRFCVSLRERAVSLRRSEVDRAKKMYRALAECVSHANWEVAVDADGLDVRFEAYVASPGFIPSMLQRLTFGLWDVTADQRQRLTTAVVGYGEKLKEHIRQKLVPQVAYSIGALPVDPSRLSARLRGGFFRRVGRAVVAWISWRPR